MKLGIIGKPQSGKTTVFNAAAERQEAVGDFSQASHRAIIKVPDERVTKLAELVNPKKITFAEIDFLDAPGFTGKGKDAGATEINPEVRLVDALMLVIEAFSSDSNLCPSCHVAVGEFHTLGCPVEICPWCSGQLTYCNCRFTILDTDALDKAAQIEKLQELLEAEGRVVFKKEHCPGYPTMDEE